MKKKATFQWSTAMHFICLSCCILLIGISCKKDNTTSTPASSGPSTLSFSYTGFKTGSFSAVGEYQSPPPAGGGLTDYTWATSQHFTDFGKKWTLINANIKSSVSSRTYSNIQMTVPDNGIGNFSLPGSFSSPDEIVFDVDLGSGNLQELYLFTSGNIQITTSNLSRVIGNFTGAATDVNTPGRTIQITNGKFDLRVTQ